MFCIDNIYAWLGYVIHARFTFEEVPIQTTTLDFHICSVQLWSVVTTVTSEIMQRSMHRCSQDVKFYIVHCSVQGNNTVGQALFINAL